MRMKPGVLFDLGNTLGAYYHAVEFKPILKQALAEVLDEVNSLGLSSGSLDAAGGPGS